MSKKRTWPYSLLTPDEIGTPHEEWNVRHPSGMRVFTRHVDQQTATEAVDALNGAFDLGAEK